MANAAIGSRISLISKSEIRYEGFLDHINTQENHVGLKNVRMFGTEGRKGGAGEVPPSDNLYEFIIFRGGDIKDLSVFENQPRDPAIVNAKQSSESANNNNNASSNGSKSAWASGPPSGLRTAGGQQALTINDHDRNDRNSRGRYNNHNYNNNNNNRGGYRGGYQNNGGRGGNNNNNNNNNQFQHARPVQHTGQDFQVASDPSRAQQQVGADFDFGKAQQDFERAKQQAHQARANASAQGKKYEKKDFFDTLKPEEKTAPSANFQARRMEREQQNAVDSDTFGSDMVAAQNSRGFGRGRGGRGGRGGNRGYRGGSNNNNNNRGGYGRGQN